jgi:hypothetical protein
MGLSYHNGIAAAEIVLYIPALFIAVFLAIRHGFGRSSGWMFLIIFTLARTLGACFQLATLNDPTNTNLYTGAAVLQNIGISVLMLAALGLLSRCLDSINKSRSTWVQPKHIKLVEVMLLVGVILGIVGGVDNADALAKGDNVAAVSSLSKAAVGLFIAAFGILLVMTVMTIPSISAAEPGEHRLLVAIALSLPALLVRIIYSALGVFGSDRRFSSSNGDTSILLGMALLMELLVVVIYEGMGLSLRKLPKDIRVRGVDGIRMGTRSRSRGARLSR